MCIVNLYLKVNDRDKTEVIDFVLIEANGVYSNQFEALNNFNFFKRT